MIYEIQEITTDKASGHTYVLVWFWPSEAAKLAGPESPYLVNDFLMQLRPTAERVVTNAAGHLKRKDGTFIDRATIDRRNPPSRDDLEIETVSRPVPMEIAANIEQYMQRATVNEYSGDHTHRPGSAPFRVKGVRQPQGVIVMELDDTADPHDILKHAGVSALRSQIANRKETREAEKRQAGGGQTR